jgi:hypothetical protein
VIGLPKAAMSDERITAEALARLPVTRAPDGIWNSIEASLDAPAKRAGRFWQWHGWAYAAVAVLLIAGTALYWHSAHRTLWEVVRTIGSRARTETIGAGEWLQTDASSHAEMRVGTIGTVKIAPGTRLRVLTTRPDEHRLSLQHGEISATISAPPNLFFVETKSATAVDPGCQYRMKVDDAGNGLFSGRAASRSCLPEQVAARAPERVRSRRSSKMHRPASPQRWTISTLQAEARKLSVRFWPRRAPATR